MRPVCGAPQGVNVTAQSVEMDGYIRRARVVWVCENPCLQDIFVLIPTLINRIVLMVKNYIMKSLYSFKT